MKASLFSFAFFVPFFIIQAQIVNTVSEGSFSDGLGIDSQGNIYGSDYGGDSVYKYNPNTDIVTIFDSGFAFPNGIGVTPEDEIFICEAGGGTIYKYDTSGTILDSYTGLVNPTGIQYSVTDEVLIWVSYNQSSINYLNPNTGVNNLIFSGPPLNGPSGIAFIDGNTYISNFNDRKIFRLDEDQTLIEITQLPSIGAPSLDFLGFLSSKDGKLIATHIGGHRIFKIDPISGDFEVITGSLQGSNDGPLANATFSRPNGILGDPINNKIYVTDSFTRNLRVISGITLSDTTITSEETTINIYTNDAKNLLTIKTNLRHPNYQIGVYDISGKLVFQNEGSVNNLMLEEFVPIGSWASGIYIVKVSDGTRNTTKKFIK